MGGASGGRRPSRYNSAIAGSMTIAYWLGAGFLTYMNIYRDSHHSGCQHHDNYGVHSRHIPSLWSRQFHGYEPTITAALAQTPPIATTRQYVFYVLVSRLHIISMYTRTLGGRQIIDAPPTHL